MSVFILVFKNRILTNGLFAGIKNIIIYNPERYTSSQWPLFLPKIQLRASILVKSLSKKGLEKKLTPDECCFNVSDNFLTTELHGVARSNTQSKQQNLN